MSAVAETPMTCCHDVEVTPLVVAIPPPTES
jgi:hypothetical protein